MDEIGFLIVLLLLIISAVYILKKFKGNRSPRKSGKWIVKNPGQGIITIFYHGLNFTQTHMAAYTRDFISVTNEIVSCVNGIDVIHRPFIGKEIDEVIPRDKSKTPSLSLYLQFQFSKFKHWYLDTVVKSTEMAGDITLSQFGIDRKLVNIGGEKDVEEHKIKYDLWRQNFPQTKCILYGVSRGAATTFCAISKYKYEGISLVVLEGCFGKVENVLKSRNFGSIIYKSIDFIYPSFDKNGKEPLDYVDSFPGGFPVVFITSAADVIIPRENTIHLAQMLANQKRNKVYLLQLQKSHHSTYPFGDEKGLYYCFLHNIYRTYDLPHIEVPYIDIDKYCVTPAEV